MQRAKSKATSNPWAALDAELQKPKELRPTGEGWRTHKELCKAWGAGIQKVYGTVRKLIAEGRLEVFRGYVAGSNGRPAQATWYRPKP